MSSYSGLHSVLPLPNTPVKPIHTLACRIQTDPYGPRTHYHYPPPDAPPFEPGSLLTSSINQSAKPARRGLHPSQQLLPTPRSDPPYKKRQATPHGISTPHCTRNSPAPINRVTIQIISALLSPLHSRQVPSSHVQRRVRISHLSPTPLRLGPRTVPTHSNPLIGRPTRFLLHLVHWFRLISRIPPINRGETPGPGRHKSSVSAPRAPDRPLTREAVELSRTGSVSPPPTPYPSRHPLPGNSGSIARNASPTPKPLSPAGRHSQLTPFGPHPTVRSPPISYHPPSYDHPCRTSRTTSQSASNDPRLGHDDTLGTGLHDQGPGIPIAVSERLSPRPRIPSSLGRVNLQSKLSTTHECSPNTNHREVHLGLRLGHTHRPAVLTSPITTPREQVLSPHALPPYQYLPRELATRAHEAAPSFHNLSSYSPPGRSPYYPPSSALPFIQHLTHQHLK
uniref:Uncharacterized protein n=1 Tax=Knipowitschia caucasica TaxID=637954 RepID=A0AAV2JC48_KNICA